MILKGEDDHVESEHRGRKQILALKRGERYAPENGSLCNIQYAKEKVFKRNVKPVIKNGPVGERW